MTVSREIPRLRLVLGRTHRDVACSAGVSVGAVHLAVSRAKTAGLDWAAVEALSDSELEARLYGIPFAGQNRPLPDFGYVHAERKKKGVTLELLHHEYLEQHPDGYRYSHFFDYYREWLTRRRLTMRQGAPRRRWILARLLHRYQPRHTCQDHLLSRGPCRSFAILRWNGS